MVGSLLRHVLFQQSPHIARVRNTLGPGLTLQGLQQRCRQARGAIQLPYNQTRLEIRKERRHPIATELLAKDNLAPEIHGVHLKHVLRQLYANRLNLHLQTPIARMVRKTLTMAHPCCYRVGTSIPLLTKGWNRNTAREWLIDFGGRGYVALYQYDGETALIVAVRHRRVTAHLETFGEH